MPKQGRLYVPIDVHFVDEYAHMTSDAVRLFVELLSFAKKIKDGYLTETHVRRATSLVDFRLALRELFDAGLIEAEVEANGVCFAVFIPSFQAWNGEANTKQSAGRKGGVASGIARRAAKQIEAGTEAQPKQLLEQEEKRREEKSASKEAHRSPSAREIEKLFNRFWRFYPRRVGKVAARKAWDKAIKSVDPVAIIAGADRYAKERAAEDPQFTAHPSTWLNAGRWSDEPSVLAGANTAHAGDPSYDPDAPSIFD